MKTYEIKMNRSRRMSLLIAILCVAIIVTLCTPYFTYGKATSSYVPQIGDQEMLYGKTWVLSDVAEGTDGYQYIEISKDGKDSKVYTTNILRVNQVAALEVYKTAVDNYNTIAKNVEDTEVAMLECQDLVAAMTAAGADTAAAQKKLDEAVKVYGIAQTQLTAAKEAVDAAAEAAALAYSVDSAFAWISVDQTAEYKALFEAYPEEYDEAIATSVRADAFKAFVAQKYADEFEAYKTANNNPKKPESKFYDSKMPNLKASEKTALYAEFMASQNELTDKELSDAGAAIINVLTGKMSASEYDEKINGKLKGYKTTSAEAAAKTAAAKKATETALKEGDASKTTTKAVKDIEAIKKEMDKASVTAEAKTYTATPVDRIDRTAELKELSAKQADQKEIMVTTATVKYNKGKVSFTFANGDKKDTTFATSVAYDSTKTISILGYVGFPYNAEEFSADLAYEIKDFYINDVVLLPILIALLAVIGIVLCFVKKDSFVSGILPAAAGIVGIIGYLCSDFMKLGDKFTTHIIVYAIVLAVSCLHIFLGIKEKKATKA